MLHRKQCWLAVVAAIPLAIGVSAIARSGSGGSPGPGSGGSGVAGGSGSGGGAAGTGGIAGSGGGCPTSCDDDFDCTVDTCAAGHCTHSIGPNSGATACPVGQYCTVEKGCVASPACATTDQCVESLKGDACKTNIKCDPKSSVCLFDILDKDADKHPPIACGGDDCDDSNASVHPGATESCNGEDDDCDGAVDNEATCPNDPDKLQECADMHLCQCKTENSCPSGCVNKQTDPANCGQCGNACVASANCTDGKCVCAAADQCDGVCVDKANDLQNCGGCGITCPEGGVCNAGECVCLAEQVVCGGTCVDTTSDALHCGGCGNLCEPGQECIDGSCGIPVGGACTWQAGKDPCTKGSWCHGPGCGIGTCQKVPTCKGYGGGALDPVCGCDGLTYWNGFSADCAMMSVASSGVCSPGIPCGGPASTPCVSGYCNQQASSGGSCGSASGTCWGLHSYSLFCDSATTTSGVRMCADSTCARMCSAIKTGAPYYSDPTCPP